MFEDRLVSVEDREWFQKLLHTRLSQDFEMNASEVLGKGPLLFGDFMMPNTDNKVYDEVTDMEKVMCGIVKHESLSHEQFVSES